MGFSISLSFDEDVRVDCDSFSSIIYDRDGGKQVAPKWMHEEMRSLHHALNGGQLMVRIREHLFEMRDRAENKWR